ncbi:uracil DNA glycosylase, partial [Ascosphaera atra]
HAKRGWERFTQKVIDTVAASRTNGIVFMAWGTPAGQRVAKIDRRRHLVLQAVHPSPLSAHRGFMKCGHFKKANEWLQERYGEDGPINWSLVPPKAAAGKAITQAASASTTTTTQIHEKITVTQKTAEKKDEYDDDEIEALLVSETNLS